VAEASTDLFCPLEFRYGRERVRSIFSRERRLERALSVEAALAETQAELEIVPADAARAIADSARSGRVRLERVDALERELKHDVMAVARALGEVAGPSGAWVHFGATSADITDTALALELREAIAIVREDLTDLTRALIDRAREYRETPEVARTHGQHAVPFTFGYKLAVAAAEIVRHRRRLDELTPRVTVGKISGAVGTGAGYGPRAGEIETRTLARLGLEPDEAPTQVVGRDRLAELTNFLALLAGTAERVSTEVRNLQRTEIAEAAEPFDERTQVGSSTMAQKRNPTTSENVTSLARLVRAFAWPPLENMALWHERDLSNSANERVVVPHALLLTDDILRKLVDIVRGLRVDPERMRVNLELTGGSPMTEGLMLALTAKGLPRSEAHETLRALSGPGSRSDRRTLAERARADPTIRAKLSDDDIDRWLRPDTYIAASAEKTARLLDRLEAELT
jgi:adenylosuccinate lyase